MGEDIEGAMQQAPHPLRQEKSFIRQSMDWQRQCADSTGYPELFLAVLQQSCVAYFCWMGWSRRLTVQA
jgi:hypothetical protein